LPGRQPWPSLRLVERIVDWILELAAVSRAPVERLGTEWRRLVDLAAAAARNSAVPIPLPEAPFFDPVLQHNDLGGWSIVVGHQGFTTVDWESSRRYGAPLWELWYFLAHVMPLLARIATPDIDGYLRRLFRGEDRWSGLLFRWTDRAAAEAGIPASQRGTLATLYWLHHEDSRPARAAALAEHGAYGEPLALLMERLPRIWLTDDGLGPSWRCFRR
jgi:hypothetical protein